MSSEYSTGLIRGRHSRTSLGIWQGHWGIIKWRTLQPLPFAGKPANCGLSIPAQFSLQTGEYFIKSWPECRSSRKYRSDCIKQMNIAHYSQDIRKPTTGAKSSHFTHVKLDATIPLFNINRLQYVYNNSTYFCLFWRSNSLISFSNITYLTVLPVSGLPA